MAALRTPVKGVVEYAQVVRGQWPFLDDETKPADAVAPGIENPPRVFLRILAGVLMDDGEVVYYESQPLEFRPVKK